MVGRGGGRLLRVVAAASAVVVVAELAVRWRADDLPAPVTWSAPELDVKEGQIDQLEAAGGASTVFLGSSTVDVGVDPSALEPDGSGPRPSYNAATGAASIGMIDLWARHVVIPRLDPDVVVVGVVSRELNPNDPEQARIEGEFLRSKAVERLTGRESVPERVERHLESWSRLLEYRPVIRRPALLLGLADDDRTYGRVVAPDGQYEGFLDRPYRFGPQVAEAFTGRALRRFEIGDEQVRQLDGLLDFLGRSGARVLLVNMPVTEDYVRLHPGGAAQYEQYRSVLSGLAERAGAGYVDAGVWPSDRFADPVHLNASGAAHLTTLLADQLRVDP